MYWDDKENNIMSSIICTLRQIRIIKSRRMRCAGHVEDMEKKGKYIQGMGGKV
jgi:hypothetical protein